MPVNPATGQPVRARTSSSAATSPGSLAEFWADGPKSETPPGHWNVLANDVSDELGPEPPDRRRGRAGRPPRVGRQAVPRAQRRGPRRRDRRLGPQGPLRLRPPDLDDPVHRGARASRATRRCPATTGRDCRSCRASSSSSRPRRRRPASATPPSRGTRARSRSVPGRAIQPTRRREIGGVGWILAVGLGAVPAADIRDAGIPGLRLGPQHVQPCRRRGDDRLHRQRVFPRRDERLHDPGRLAQVREGPHDRHPASSGRRTTTPPTRRASRGCTAASTSPADDFTGRMIGSRVRQGRVGARAQRYYAGTAGS